MAQAEPSLSLEADGVPVPGTTVHVWGSGGTQQHVAADVVAIAAGDNHQLALKSDGTVVAYGNNFHGETQVPAGLTDVIAIAAGASHSVALKADGSVVAWGSDNQGETTVPLEAQSNVKAIAAGEGFTAALKTNGTLITWGADLGMNGLSGIQAIAARSWQLVVLEESGNVYSNIDHVSHEFEEAHPVAIAAGDSHFLILRSDGKVTAHGQNHQGQTSVPEELGGVIAIAAGVTHSVALKSDGSIVNWGGTFFGQLNTPAGLPKATCIAAGGHNTMALTGQRVEIPATVTKTITLKNTGAEPLNISSVNVQGGQFGDFALNTAGMSSTLAAGNGQTSFSVTFNRLEEGYRQTTLQIVTDDPARSVVAVSLVGTAPEILVEQPAGTEITDGETRAFSDTLVGEESFLEFTIRNTGNVPLNLDYVDTYSMDEPIDWLPYDEQEFDFEIYPDLTSLAGPGGSLTYRVKFSPKVAGMRQGVLRIGSSDSDEGSIEIHLQGFAKAPKLVVYDINSFDPIPNGGSLQFPQTNLGSFTVVELYLYNEGDADLVIESGEISPWSSVTFEEGTEGFDFDFNWTSPITIAPDSGREVFIRFTPEARGARKAFFALETNDPEVYFSDSWDLLTGFYEISLEGVGAEPEMSLQQPVGTSLADNSTKAFPATLMGGSSELEFTIVNTGNADIFDLYIDIYGDNNSDFTVLGTPDVPIIPNGSTTFTVRFSPGMASARNTSMYVSYFDDNGFYGDIAIQLTGTGLAVLPTVSGISPNNGSTAGGTSVTITGTGFTGTTGVSFGGTASTSFIVDSATQIQAIAPAHEAGAVSVLVTTPSGTNAANTLFTYVVPDTTPPDTTLTSGPGESSFSKSSEATFTFTGTDNVAVTGFEGRLDGAPFATVTSPVTLTGLSDGSHTYEVRARDGSNNVDPTPASVTWVVDTAAPTFTLPEPITVEATGPSGAVVTYAASASDAGSGVASSSFIPASGSTFASGTTTVNASATDNAGNMAEGSFTVTVQDTTAPVVAAPAEGFTLLALTADAGTGTANLPDYRSQVVASDQVGVVSLTQTPAPGSVLGQGTVQVSITAEDAAGNVSDTLVLTVVVGPAAAPVAGWSFTAWTGDSTTGIHASTNVWAYRFGSATAATVNGVTVPGSPFSLTSANVDVTLTSSFQGAVNNLTALGGTGSARLAQDFVYNGVQGPLTATVKNLTVGQEYVVSFFGVGFDPVAARNVNFTSGADSQVVNQNHYGLGNGIRVDYNFTATAATQSFTLMETVPLYSWGLNAIALSMSASTSAPTVAVNAKPVITNISGPHDNATNLAGEKTASGFQMNADTPLGRVRWKGNMNVAELWSDDGTGNPGSLLLPLVTLSPGVAEASEPFLLAAGVKYWIVWDNTSGGGNDITLSSHAPSGTSAAFLGNRRKSFTTWSEWPILNFMVEVQEARTAGFTDTASLTPGRDAHTATKLQDGRVLVAGGGGAATSCALYDPVGKTWTPTGSLAGGRQNHTATLLPDGRVLVAGGYDAEASVASAEIYDPATGAWTSAGSMDTSRFDHGAALLPDGRVLVLAGREYDYWLNVDNMLLSAEIYDPLTNTWSAAASLTRGRYEFTTTALPGGKVLAVGGYGVTGFLTQAEIYDPATDAWSSAGSLNAGRYEHTATLLLSGKVLVAGGYEWGGLRADAELYDPDTNSWSQAGTFATARDRHAAALLPDGRVIIAGGNTATGAITSAQIYDPETHAWSDAGSLSVGRREHTATELADGNVLFVGGYGQPGLITGAELFSSGVEVITVAEGSEGSISGTFHDADGNATVTVSTSSGSIYKNNAGGTWHWSKTGVNGPARERVTVTATDDLGAAASTSFVFSVTNVAPVFELGANTFLPALTGILNRTVSFTDPGADTWSGTVDYGDGSGAQALLVDQAARTFTLDHVYDFDGVYTVTVTLQDGDGGIHADSYQLTRDSRPPSIGLGSFVFTVPQGSTSVTIPLVRMIGSQALSFQLSTVDGTASTVPPFAAGLAGKDYQALTTAVDFAEGEMQKEVEISLIPRAGTNVPNTRFQVVLTGAGWEDIPADPKLGHPITATVQVLANDTTRPTLTVKSPASGATLNRAPPVIITGTVGDKYGIDRVEIEHDGDLIVAGLGSATRSTSIPFSGEIYPAADGPVTFTVTAYDLKGNSTVVTRTFNHIRWYDVVVSRSVPDGLATPEAAGMVTLASTKGSFSTLKPAKGSIDQQGSVLPGAPVTLTARPAAGHVFSHWEGLPVDAVMSGTVASFTMPAEDVTEILAVFVANPFAALGTTAVFHGLLAPPEAGRGNATLGSLSATLTTKTGALSGKLLLGGVTTPFAGTVQGNGDVWLKNTGGPMAGSLEIPGLGTLALVFASDTLDISLIGAETDSFGTARVAIHSAANPVPAGLLNDAKQGFYTVALPALEQTPSKPASAYPQGAGYGSLTLKTNGTITLTGVLADGSKFTAASALVAGNTSPVHAQLPTPGSTTLKGGSLLGVLAFDPDAPDSDVSSASLGWAVFGSKGGPPPEIGSGLLWLRPEVVQQTGTTAAALATQLYTEGWEQGITVGLVGALYHKAVTVQSALGLPATGPDGNAQLLFEDGKLDATVGITEFNVDGSKAIKLLASDKRFTLTLTANTGLMKGTFTPYWSSPGPALPAFNGVILQKGANQGGWGFFLSNRAHDLDPESGGVTLGNP